MPIIILIVLFGLTHRSHKQYINYLNKDADIRKSRVFDHEAYNLNMYALVKAIIAIIGMALLFLK